ncbi:MAG TPA: ATP-binding protein, partial [Clostridia bacterium]|nr:ATP-binding protein [Clostridia bacterium]
MKELSLNILDIASNSITAKATKIEITVKYVFSQNLLSIEIIDNGCGMDEEMVKRVSDPFTTTRKTRNVGLGIPFFKESAVSSGGQFSINSKIGEGTKVSATYQIDNIDRMPLGNLAETICTLISAKNDIRYVLTYRVDEREFVLDTDEVRNILGEVDISNTE